MSASKPAPSKSIQRLDSSTDRVLSILDLFTEAHPVWTTEVLIERLGVARATMYRYLRALVETGFLTPDGGGAYSLGPRSIEMDRQIRMADPLLQVAPPVMQSLRPAFTGDQLLCRYYGLRVLSILEDRMDPQIKAHTSFDRGRPFPLFLGAPSRIILANLTQQQLQRLFLHHAQDITAAGLGRNWLEFRDNMRQISKQGWVAASDIDKNLIGVAAPVFLPSGEVTASLCLVKMRDQVTDKDVAALAQTATRAAADISAKLRERRPVAAATPRAPASAKKSKAKPAATTRGKPATQAAARTSRTAKAA